LFILIIIVLVIIIQSYVAAVHSIRQQCQQTLKKRLNNVYVTRSDVQEFLKYLICKEHFRPALPPDMPDDLATLVQQAWHPDPKQRPTAVQFMCNIHALLRSIQTSTQQTRINTNPNTNAK
jgi:hypothetical protein